MAAFVAAEIELFSSLTRRADERQRVENERAHSRQQFRRQRRNGEPAPPDFADGVIEELKQRVTKYTPIGIGHDELWELDHLYGALKAIEREHWPRVERIYRRLYPSRFSGPRLVLENRLNELVEARADEFPKRLYPIRELLERFPRTLRQIEWESKRCILQAAFYLHSLDDELARLIEDSYLGAEDKKTVERVREFVHTVIEDFRLQDLKEQGHTSRS
jgi:hypothetical protein